MSPCVWRGEGARVRAQPGVDACTVLEVCGNVLQGVCATLGTCLLGLGYLIVSAPIHMFVCVSWCSRGAVFVLGCTRVCVCPWVYLSELSLFA